MEMNAAGGAASGELEIGCSGERLVMSPQRALVWPRRRTLLLGDSHFGKGAVFRRAGIALPAGAAQTDLARLAELIHKHGIERVIVLGDFFHGRVEPDEPFVAAFASFRRQHRALEIASIAGNHDRWSRHSELANMIRWLDEGTRDEPFVYAHRAAAQSAAYTLSGHLHPVVRLTGPGRDRLSAPVFWFRQHSAVLPAFGTFTGGYRIRPDRSDRMFAVTPGAVLPVATVW
jgi:DNA ligase-associated metallophosphoesterase